MNKIKYLIHFTFFLMFSVIGIQNTFGQCPDVFLSEVGYDCIGNPDANEVLEVALENTFSGALSELTVTLYNGSNGSVYGTETMDNFTIGNTDGSYTFYTWTPNSIQNGSPDGIAINFQGEATPCQFASYEGTFTAVGGAADGFLSTDIGASQTNSTTCDLSLQLVGGVFVSGCATPGEVNVAGACTACVVTIDDISTANPTCTGAVLNTDGTITIMAIGANLTGTLEYSIDGFTTSNSTGIFSGLSGGNYTVEVRDNGDVTCNASSVETLVNPDCNALPCPDVFLNEIGYDCIGNPDVNEVIEIALENAYTGDLSDITVTLYNGSNGSTYGAETLDNFTIGATNGIYTYYTWIPSSVQNGGSDGVAITYQSLLSSCQFVSYEGTLTATNGPANGETSINIGASQNNSTDCGLTLQLIDGIWQSNVATAGAENLLPPCVLPTITGLGTCSNGVDTALDGEYYIELNVENLAGLSSMIVSDGTTTTTTSATGSIFFGPYVNGENNGTVTFTAGEIGGDPLCVTTIEVAEIYCLENYGGAALACDCEAAIPGFILSQIMPGAFDASVSDMVYVLIAPDGSIEAVNTTGYFDNLADADYSISAINVDDADTANLLANLAIGTNYAGIDLNPYCVDVCPIPTPFTVACPIPTCNPTANTPCEGDDLNLMAGDTNGNTYAWTGPNGFISTEQNPTISAVTLAAAGTYTLEVTNTTSNCTSSCDLEVNINSNPVLIAQNIDLCADVTTVDLTLLETAIGETGGVWSAANAIVVDPSLSPFLYTYTNAMGCSSSTTVIYTILDLPVVTPSVNLPICNGIDIELSANPATDESFVYSWTGPNGFTSIEENPIILANNDFYPGIGTFTYFVTITSTDATPCSSAAIPVLVTIDANPHIVCRQPTSIKTLPGECYALPNILPPFIIDESSGIASMTNDAPDGFGTGETIVTWTIEDICGQTQTCETSITVTDFEHPEFISCATAIAWTGENCQAVVTVSSVATDNCGEPIIEGNGTYVFSTGIHPLLVTATDASGNVTEHNFTVYVHDDIEPNLEYCPDNITITTINAESGNVFLPTPNFTDNCEIISLENDAPSIFTESTTEVIWTATDSYGLTNTCTYNVNVSDEAITIDYLQALESSVENATAKSIVRWNAPIIQPQCQACLESDYEDFEYIGDYYGHQYFKYIGGEVTWNEANEIAENTFNGHLASINTSAENTFLYQNANTNAENLWVGMSIHQDEEGNYNYNWSNNATYDFNSFGDVISLLEESSAVVLNSGGIWNVVEETELHAFIVERPCINLTQTEPMVEVENEEGEMITKLLAMGDEWPIGDYIASYVAQDQCGNEYQASFPVKVDENQANYCPTGGADTDIYVRQVNIGGNRNNSISASYEDFTDEVRDVELYGEAPFENHVFLELVSGENAVSTEIFWRVWIDLNNDGDFYDADEMVVEKSSTNLSTKAYLPKEYFTSEEKHMRVALSRYDYPEACLDFWAGEAEDYLVSYSGLQEGGFNIENISNGGGNWNGNTLTESNVSIQPNPAQEYIQLDLPNLKTVSIVTIYSTSGQVLLRTEVGANLRSKTIDVKSLQNGLFFLEIRNGETQVQKKIVITK